jgi:SagB-type dehydrogenase family enzyme
VTRSRGFAARHPLAWLFHRNTVFGPHNLPAPAPEAAEAPFKEYLAAPTVSLPEPQPLSCPLGEAVGARLSCRRFAPSPLELDRVGTLLASAYGVQRTTRWGDGEFLERPVPSGGALYPLEVYLVAARVDGLALGVYHYAALGHLLERCGGTTPPPPDLARLFLGQPYAGDAAGVLVLTSIVERSLCKYQDRGYRYILFEAGHAAQNVNLAAAALGIGALNLGGFLDAELTELLGLEPEEEIPLYCIALGNPAAAGRNELREPVAE